MRYIFPKDDPDQTLRPVIMPGLYQSDTVKDNDPFYSLTHNQFWFEVEMSHNEVYIRLRGQCHLEWETYAGESQYTTFLKAENTSLKLSWLSNTAFFFSTFWWLSGRPDQKCALRTNLKTRRSNICSFNSGKRAFTLVWNV